LSVRSLTTLAVARDAANYHDPAKGGSAGAGSGSSDQSFTDALTSAIPTEPLAAYTALIAVVAASKSQDDQYLAVRWWVYAAFLVVVVASVEISYRIKVSQPAPVGVDQTRHRLFPFLEILSATIAAAAWGLVAPGSGLQTMLQGETATIAVACITIGGAALISLIAPALTKGSNTPK
jgi:hypothetical protein